MARGINKVIIVGNLGQDPESKTFPDGGTLTTISVATSTAWKDKQTGQQQERTEWHRIVFNNKLAEIAMQYLRKGKKVYVEGYLRTRKWQDEQGGDRYSTEIIAREMQMLDSRTDAAAGSMDHSNFTQGQSSQQPAAQPAPNFDDMDDDIPF